MLHCAVATFTCFSNSHIHRQPSSRAKSGWDRLSGNLCRHLLYEHCSAALTDIQVPDIQLSDTQVPDTQAPGRPGPQTSRSFGHPGPWTSRSLDIQVFRTSRSFGRPGPWTSKSPDVQVFRTSRSRKSNAHTLILDWCAFALDGVKNVTDGPTDKAFLGVGYNFKPNIDQNLLNCLW